jgi:hypothetical protein
MKILIKNELDRAFRNKWMFITLAVCSMIIIYDLCAEVIPTRKTMEMYINTWGYPIPNLYNTWMELNGVSISSRLLHFIFPLLVCIPYAESMYSDVKSKYIYNVIVRVEKKKYFLAKLITQFIVGFTVVMSTLLTSFVLTEAILPIGFPMPGLVYIAENINVLGKAFYKNPFITSIIIMISEALIFSIIGCISYIFAYLLDNGMMVMVSAFTVYFFEGVLAPLLGVTRTMMGCSYMIKLTYDTALILIFELGIITAFVVGTYFVRIRKKDEL